jgi:hypothetical protein
MTVHTLPSFYSVTVLARLNIIYTTEISEKFKGKRTVLFNPLTDAPTVLYVCRQIDQQKRAPPKPFVTTPVHLSNGYAPKSV